MEVEYCGGYSGSTALPLSPDIHCYKLVFNLESSSSSIYPSTVDVTYSYYDASAGVIKTDGHAYLTYEDPILLFGRRGTILHISVPPTTIWDYPAAPAVLKQSKDTAAICLTTESTVYPFDDGSSYREYQLKDLLALIMTMTKMRYLPDSEVSQPQRKMRQRSSVCPLL